MTESSLRAVFVAHAPEGCRLDASSGDLEDALRARLQAGRAAWPGIALTTAAFMQYVAQRTPGAELPAVERAPDLYLACACVAGSPAAAEALQRTYRDAIAAAGARVDSSRAFADDLVQAVCERVLVRTDEGRMRIADYAGRASLRGWLGAVARRTALNMRRNKADQAHQPLSSGAGELGLAVGPEIALLRARYQGEFEAAIRASMAALAPRDRALLLLHLVDGVTLPQLATMHNVSRTTVARWLASARAALHDGTRKHLTDRLKLTPSELESVAALVRSQLDLSLAQALRGDEPRRGNGPEGPSEAGSQAASLEGKRDR